MQWWPKRTRAAKAPALPAETCATACVTAQPAAAIDLLSTIRAVRDELATRTIDHRDLAVAVLTDIREQGLDSVFDVHEVNAWIDDFLTRGGFDPANVRHEVVREIIKALPGVDYRQVRIRQQDRYLALRRRLLLRRNDGTLPEKVWCFHITLDAALAGTVSPFVRPTESRAKPGTGHAPGVTQASASPATPQRRIDRPSGRGSAGAVADSAAGQPGTKPGGRDGTAWDGVSTTLLRGRAAAA